MTEVNGFKAVKITNRINIEFILVKVVGKGIELVKGDEKAEILNTLAENSKNLQNGEWLTGWRNFCEGKREQYTTAVRNAYVEDATEETNEWFNHYLYCEAHEDVMRELFKLSWETREAI